MQIVAFILALGAVIAFGAEYVASRSVVALGLAILTLAVVVQLVWTSGTVVNLT